MTEKNPAAVELGRRGGLARKKALTPKQRKMIAVKASKAAAKARTKAAKARKAKRSASSGVPKSLWKPPV
jgi:hypothetical protein